MADAQDSSTPDFRNGFSIRKLGDGGMVLGRVDTEEVILVRQGDALFAVGAHCTHYHGPLAEGLVVGDTVRCPWHHACFSLRTGEAVRAPALDPIACWRVERDGDTVFVREKLAEPSARARTCGEHARVGRHRRRRRGRAGGRGHAASRRLRRCSDHDQRRRLAARATGRISPRTFLAGTAQDDWIPLRSPEYYTERRIDLLLNSRVSSIDAQRKQVQLENGRAHGFGALLIATGADPVRLQIPGATDSQIHYLRTFADSRAIVAKAASAKRVVVVGASFIGLEVAASLRAREIAGACGRTGQAAAGARHGAGGRPLHPAAARGARRRLPPGPDRRSHRRAPRDVERCTASSTMWTSS